MDPKVKFYQQARKVSPAIWTWDLFTDFFEGGGGHDY